MHKREKWLALHSFGKTLEVVGRTRSGLPVFQVGPATVVHLPGAPYFTRAVGCNRCGDPVETQEAVVRPRDLLAEANPHVCAGCAGLPPLAAPPAGAEEGPLPAGPVTLATPGAEPELGDESRHRSPPWRPPPSRWSPPS